MKRRGIGELSLVVAVALIALMVVGGGLFACPKYSVYSARMAGEAELAGAQASKQVMVTTAVAKRDASTALAQADTIRARGIAQTNAIIGHSLKDNPEYLTWLWIEALKDGKNDVIYVPTEANLPILEANRAILRKVPVEK